MLQFLCLFIFLTHIIMNAKKILAMLAVSAITLPAFAAEDINLDALLTETPVVATNLTTSSTLIDWVDTLDNTTLVVKLANQLPGISPDSDAKVLEDIAVTSSTKSADDAKKIDVTLANDLVPGTNYSIISISEGLDSSIDFTFADVMTEIKNSIVPTGTGINHIIVKDSKNIEVYLNNESTLTTYEFKVFKELSSTNMFLDTNNVNVQLSNPILPNTDYILILNLKDLENKDIEVENSLFDFVSGDFVEAPVVEEVPAETPVVSEEVPTQPIEDVAMTVTQTPDTGAKTNVLLFLTFVLTLGVFLLKRKSFQM